MLHRSSHMFPWSYSRQGQPNDLPDIFTEDIFVLMPVNSNQLYAGWNISYEHQNSAAEIWGEERFNASRLAVKLIFLPHRENFCIYDVSGPGQSIYLQLPDFSRETPAQVQFAGLLGYCSRDLSFMPIVASSVTFMSTGRIQAAQDGNRQLLGKGARLPCGEKLQAYACEGGLLSNSADNSVKPFHIQITEAMYSDASNPESSYFNLGRLAEALDKQMGRSSLNGENK